METCWREDTDQYQVKVSKIVLTLTFGQSRIKKQKRKIFVKLFV